MRVSLQTGIIVLLGFGALVQVATAIEIVAPEPGSTTVTVTDLTIPVPPGDKSQVSPPVKIRYALAAGTVPAAKLNSGWYAVALVHFHTTDAGYRADGILYQGNATQLEAALADPFDDETSALFAIDMWNGAWTSYGEANCEPPKAAFTVAGFEEGSTSLTISGLDPGAQLWSFHVTPGQMPISTWVTEGSWADADGEANGVLITDVLRRAGPPYVLSGDIWVLALESATPGCGLWPAEDPQARFTVAVASHVIGASGTPYISDLIIANPFGLETEGWIRFLAENAAWEQASEVAFSISPGDTISWTDVLQSAFGITDNVKGTIQVGGFPLWSLKVISRNYAVDDQGNQFGIAIPGLATWDPITSEEPWIIAGLRENAQFRSNFIAAGARPQPSTITLRLFVGGQVVATMERTVPGYGLLQINRIADAMGVSPVDDGYLELVVDSGGIFAALSVVDSSAGDAAYINAERLLP